MTVHVLLGDVREMLSHIPDNCIQCVVTSPPYYQLRDYGTATWEGGSQDCDHVVGEIRTGLGLTKLGEQYRGGGHKQGQIAKIKAKGVCPKCGARRVDKQIGLEQTPDAYVANLVEVFQEVRRILHPSGVVFLNLGDSYHKGSKGLQMVPERVLFALSADGWCIRSKIVWSKPNPLPESVKDRPSSSWEPIYMLIKDERYFWDYYNVREEAAESSKKRIQQKNFDQQTGGEKDYGKTGVNPSRSARKTLENFAKNPGHSMRNVWTISNKPCALAHFATFPPEISENAIKAATSEAGCCPHCRSPWKRIVQKGEADLEHQIACGGSADGSYGGESQKDYESARAQNASDTKRRILEGMRKRITVGWEPTCQCPEHKPIPCVVLDPFLGSGTTAMVANRMGRDCIGVELNPDYIPIIEQRVLNKV